MTPVFWNFDLGSKTSFKEYSKDVDIYELFTKVYSQKLNKGGKKITADDLNNIIKTISENIFYYQRGGNFEFRVGNTYPESAIVRFDNAYWISLQETSITPGTDETWKKIFDVSKTSADLAKDLDNSIQNVNEEILSKIEVLRNDFNAGDEILQNEINSVNERIDNIDNKNTQYDTEMTQIYADYSNLLNTVTENSTKIKKNSDDITDLKNFENRFTQLESTSQVNSQNIRNLTTVTNNLNTITGSNTARITENENQIASTNSDIAQKYQEFLDYKAENDGYVESINSTVENNYTEITEKIDSEINQIKADTYTKSEIDEKVSKVYKYKGSIQNVDALPTENVNNGDTYNISETGMNYAWDEVAQKWDSLGTIVDIEKINGDFVVVFSRLDQCEERISNIESNTVEKINDDISSLDQKIDTEKQNVIDVLTNTVNENVSALQQSDLNLSDRIDQVNSSLQEMIANLRTEIMDEISSKIYTLNENIHSDMDTLNNAIQTQISETENNLTSLITKAREVKHVTIPANSHLDVSFENIDHLGMDVRVLVLDNDENSVTYNKYINSEGCCTIAFDHDKYTIYNETDSDLDFIVFLGVFLELNNEN